MNDTVNTDAGSQDPASTPEATTITDWRTNLPESVQAWEEVKTSSDADSFFNQMGEMRSMIGRSLQVPSEDASTEARQKYLQKVLEKTPEVMFKPTDDNIDDIYNAMGRPETADKYTLPEVEGVQFDMDSVNAFAPLAHETGLTNKQYQKIVASMQQNQMQSMNNAEAQRLEGLKGLQAEWGMAFDKQVATAQNYVDKVLPSIGDVKNLPASSVKELFEASKTIGSEGVALTHESGASAVMTPIEAQEKIAEIYKNADHPARNPSDPMHKQAMARLLDLQDLAHGRDPADRQQVS